MMTSDSSQRRSSRLGLTLVEVLVVTGVVGISIAVMLPLVLDAREEVREVTCLSKMRDVTEGVIRYESLNGTLPPGGLIAPQPRDCDDLLPSVFDCYPANRQFYGQAPMMSWIVLVLPYFGQQEIFDQFDFTADVFNQAKEPQNRLIPELLCPADGAGNTFGGNIWSQDKEFKKGNFAAFGAPMHLEQQHCLPGALGGFIPGEKQGQRLRRIVDGVGSTLALSEVRTNSLLEDQRGAWALPWNSSTLLAVDGHFQPPGQPKLCSIRRYVPQPPDGGPGNGPSNTPNSAAVDVLYFGCNNPIQLRKEGMPCALFRNEEYLASVPRSQHPGGVNATFLDGRGTFLSDKIDLIPYLHLVAINDRRGLDQTAK